MTDKPKTLGIPWKPGQSGNPGGRPKAVVEVVTLARSHTAAAFATLAEICTSTEAPPAARVAASQALLDRGWGKPVQTMEIKRPLAGMSDDELDSAIEFVRDAIASPSGLTANGSTEKGGGKPH